MPNCWLINAWSMVIFSPQTNHLNASILCGLPSMQEFLQEVQSWYYLMNGKQATQIGSLSHFCSLDPTHIHYNIFWISFVPASAHFRVNELPFSFYSFPLCLIMYLDRALVGTSIGMLKESTSTSKNPPSTSTNEKSVSCLISIGCSTSSSSSIALLSTCSSSS